MSVKVRKAHRYERTGYLAVTPKAYAHDYYEVPERAPQVMGACSVVTIDGPLEQFAGGWCDSYESIVAQVAEAVATPCAAVVLRINSPGGDVSGLFDAAAEVKSLCAEAGKPLFAHIDGYGCSAAYALASAASIVWCTSTAIVGSIGVLSTRCDVSAANDAQGFKVAYIASGERKADGHPDLPLSAAELASEQVMVDHLASIFFELVSGSRGISPADVAALEAGVFAGQMAADARLVDAVGTFESLLAAAANGDAELTKDNVMDLAEIKAALEKIAAGEGDDAAAAKRMLAAMEPAAEPAEGDEAAAEADDEEKPEAAADDEEKPEAKVASAAVNARLAKIEKLLGESEKARKKAEKAERDGLLAKVPEGLRAALSHSPLEALRQAVAALPKGTKPVVGTVKTTQSGAERDAARGLQGKEKAKLDARMRMKPAPAKHGVAFVNGRTFIDVPEGFVPSSASDDADKDGE